MGIEFLQLLHGFQSQRGGGIVQSQHVGGDVHEDTACNRMPFGHIRKEFAEDGTEQTGQHIHHAPLLANLHDAQPKREHARETERNLKSGL